MKCSGPHKSTWQPFYKAVTSPWLIRELFEKHWGMLCLITILVKWCLTSLTMPSGAGADTFSRGGCTCLIKNKKVAMLFMQLTGIHYPESQLGGCVCYWSTLHIHTHTLHTHSNTMQLFHAQPTRMNHYYLQPDQTFPISFLANR